VNILIQNLRQAIRSFRASPGFTLAAVLSLAIGVGANTALFSVASALLLTPLAYVDADRLAILWNRSPGLQIEEDWFSTAQYFDIKNGHTGLEQVAIAIGGNDNLTGDGEPERVGTIRMSSNLLPMLGARAEIGRLFLAEDDRPGSTGVAVLGHGTWRRRYGADPAVVGRTLVINGLPYQVVGVLPASFSLPREVMPTLNGAEDAEVALSLPLAADAPAIRTREDYNILAKLKPGVTRDQAQAEMNAITARLRAEHPAFYPPNGGLTFDIVPLQHQVVGDVRQSVLVLMAAVGCVLLIACVNVANLMLSRALARQQEIAIRSALGASRRQIIGQLLTESVTLGVAGGAVGLIVAAWGLDQLHRLGAGSVPRLGEIGIDRGVLLFTLVLSVVSGILFGLVPALRVSRIDLQGQLKDAARGAAGTGALWARGQYTRRSLVVLELALAVVLLIGAGLLIRSFAGLLNTPPGFNPSNVLTLELSMSGRKYGDAAAIIESYRQMWERLARLPGVTAVGGVSALPLSRMFAWGPITVEGRTPPAGEEFINADMRFVGGDYFRAMDIPLIEGRFFNDNDTRANPRVIIVDTRMARELWPGQSAIGKHVKTGGQDSKSPWLTVVGVVGAVKQYTLDADSRIAMHFPVTQSPVRGMNVVLSSRQDPETLTAAVRAELKAIDPDLPMYRVRTMEARVGESLARRRFAMLLLSVFAALALALAAIGVYGVMSYLVNQGSRELGIRLALGATPHGISRLILGSGLQIALLGVGAGVAGAWALTRFMQSLLFGVDATDPVTFIVIPLVLAAVTLLASYLPARRATRIDPVVCLRSE
jgi:predicted permease